MFGGFRVTPAKIMSGRGFCRIRPVINRDNSPLHRFAKPLMAQNITNIRNFPLKSTTYAIPADRTFKNI